MRRHLEPDLVLPPGLAVPAPDVHCESVTEQTDTSLLAAAQSLPVPRTAHLRCDHRRRPHQRRASRQRGRSRHHRPPLRRRGATRGHGLKLQATERHRRQRHDRPRVRPRTDERNVPAHRWGTDLLWGCQAYSFHWSDTQRSWRLQLALSIGLLFAFTFEIPLCKFRRGLLPGD